MKQFFYGVVAGVLVTVATIIAYKIGSKPDLPSEPRTFEIDKPQPTRFHAPKVLPPWRYLYRVRSDTVTIRVPVPVDFGDVRGVLPVDYIDVGRRTVSVRYFSPGELRWAEDRYYIPRPTWGFEIAAGTGYSTGDGILFYLSPSLRYRSWTGWVAGGASSSGGPELSFGLQYSIYSLE
jgi:hypothetical protein